MSTWTVEPAGPRSSLNTSSLVIVLGTGFSSIATIWSPARIPSRYDGVPSIGEITTITPSRMSNWMPIPEYSPWKFSSI